MQAAGLAVAAVGLALFVASLRRFATEGRGTLAPWDPRASWWYEGPTDTCAIR